MIFVIIALFNIGINASSDELRISVLWIPVKTIEITHIERIVMVHQAPFSERATLGLHAIACGWSYHAGPATTQIITVDGRIIRVSAKNSPQLLDLKNHLSAHEKTFPLFAQTLPASTCRHRIQAAQKIDPDRS